MAFRHNPVSAVFASKSALSFVGYVCERCELGGWGPVRVPYRRWVDFSYGHKISVETRV